MKRGEIWTVQGEGFMSKPRPVVVIQSDSVADFSTVLICLLTSFDSKDVLTRPAVAPSTKSGLRKLSYMMTDKLAAVTRDVLGYKIGELSQDELTALDSALKKILGL